MAVLGPRSTSHMSSQSLATSLPLSTSTSFIAHSTYTENKSTSKLIPSRTRSSWSHQYQKRSLHVSQKTLHRRRGISRGGGPDAHGRQLIQPDHDIIPQGFKDVVQDAISQYDSDSDRSSPITAQYLETSNANWTANLTGNTTDRSSSYSTVTYDVFDKEASQKVQDLFDQIDTWLYEPGSSTTPQLFDECKDWSHTFPHMRVLGTQLLESSEQGYHSVEMVTTSRPDTTDSIGNSCYVEYLHYSSASTDQSNSLIVEGSSIAACSYTPSSAHSFDALEHDSTDIDSLHEEVIEIDGHYEDIIAIDSDVHDDHLDSKLVAAAQRQRRSRYPPVSPNACAKDDIMNSVFDTLWNTFTDCVRLLLQRYSEHFVITHPMAISDPSEDDNGVSVGLKLPQIPIYTTRYDSTVHLPHTRFNVQARPSPHYTPTLNNQGENLYDVLNIRKKALNHREKTFTDEVSSETPIGMMLNSTVSQAAAKKASSALRNQSATGGKKIQVRPVKLASLNDRVKTPSVDDEILRVQSIYVGKRLNSPPMNGGRSTLPPISNHSELSMAAETGQHHPKTNNKRANRACSAVAMENEMCPTPRNKPPLMNDTRPSTTHTVYPTDQMALGNLMLHRSSTPMDNRVRLNVTGSRFIHHSQVEEEAESRYDSTQWAPTGGYRKNRTLNSSFVR